mgnify:CR=1 FL=1
MGAGRISFREQPLGDQILVAQDGLSDGLWAEISQLLLSYRASPKGKSLVISALDLRLSAHDLASVIRREGVATDYDDATRRLFELHLVEVRARKNAEQDATSLLPEAVAQQIMASGRFVRRMTDNQERDLGRLLLLRHGANFSVPGAGKTATLLAVYEAGRAEGRLDRLLIVAPKNAFLSWEEEIGLCYAEETRPRVARITGGRATALDVLSSDPEITIVTYQFLPNVLDMISEWLRRGKSHVVLDESHRIKSGANGVYGSAALRLSTLAERRDVLSGTPMPNRAEDLRAQVEFLWPGQRILPEARLDSELPDKTLEQLHRVVRPLYVRTTKRELRLPELEVVPVVVDLGPLHREVYELLRSEAKRLAAGMNTADRRFLRSLGSHVLRLIVATSNPMLVAQIGLSALEESEEQFRMQAWDLLREIARSGLPAKVAKTVQLAEEALNGNPTHKVLIWTSFVQNVLFLEKLLARFNPVVLYGSIGTGSEEDSDTREGRIRRFHRDGQCRVMIANPAACGESISLHHACHHAIYLDRTFNAAHYLQSVDRIHRLGLPENVVTRVEILEARRTVDGRVARRLKAKITAMGTILDDPGLAALVYDPEDVVEEFPAGIERADVEEIMEHIVSGEDDGDKH